MSSTIPNTLSPTLTPATAAPTPPATTPVGNATHSALDIINGKVHPQWQMDASGRASATLEDGTQVTATLDAAQKIGSLQLKAPDGTQVNVQYDPTLGNKGVRLHAETTQGGTLDMQGYQDNQGTFQVSGQQVGPAKARAAVANASTGPGAATGAEAAYLVVDTLSNNMRTGTSKNISEILPSGAEPTPGLTLQNSVAQKGPQGLARAEGQSSVVRGDGYVNVYNPAVVSKSSLSNRPLADSLLADNNDIGTFDASWRAHGGDSTDLDTEAIAYGQLLQAQHPNQVITADDLETFKRSILAAREEGSTASTPLKTDAPLGTDSKV